MYPSSSLLQVQFVQLMNNARSLFNFGGIENNVENKPNVFGHKSNVNIGVDPSKTRQETLVCTIRQNVGRIFEGDVDLVCALAQWIGHIQENS